MFDEWQSSNPLSCPPINHSSFYPPVAEQHPTENFYHCNPTIVAPALCPISSPKRQCLEPISTHDIQNQIGIFYDSASSSGSPPHLPFSESTLRPFNAQKCIPQSQLYSPDCFLSEDSSPSQISYSSESDTAKSEAFFPGNCGAPGLPNQTAFPTVGVVMDQLETTPREPRFQNLSHAGLCSNYHLSLMDASGVSVPPIPFFRSQSSIDQQSDLFNNSQLTYEQEYEDKPPFSAEGETGEKKDSSGNAVSKVKRFACSECGQRFARAFNLQTHIATHSGTRPFSCPADGCSKAFSRRHDLGRHMSAVHQQWLALRNLSVSEAVKSSNCKTSTPGRRKRAIT